MTIGTANDYQSAQTISPDLHQLAQRAVRSSRRRLKLSDADWFNHRDDMMQTALAVVWEHQHHEHPYLWGILRHKLTDYALVHVYGRQTGKKAAAARGYFVNNLHDFDDDDNEGDDLHTIHWGGGRETRQRRPVEESLLYEESAVDRERFWDGVRRELAAIFTISGGSCWRVRTIEQQTEIILKRLQGQSNAAIALDMALTPKQVTMALERAREKIRHFLAQSPTMQGLLRAEGELSVYWPDEITGTVLNRGQKFIAVMPQGMVTVRYSAGLAYVSAALKSEGKVRNRMNTLGKVGQLTKSDLLAGLGKLQASLDDLLAYRRSTRSGVPAF